MTRAGMKSSKLRVVRGLPPAFCWLTELSYHTVAVAMDIADRVFATNRDWDPHQLREIVMQDFYDFMELWQSEISDMELVALEGPSGSYCPVVEDMSLDDEGLYEAVAQIEQE